MLLLLCNEMSVSVFRFDCSKINAETDILNQHLKQKKSKPLQKVALENV